jgi:hypothetical protein
VKISVNIFLLVTTVRVDLFAYKLKYFWNRLVLNAGLMSKIFTALRLMQWLEVLKQHHVF